MENPISKALDLSPMPNQETSVYMPEPTNSDEEEMLADFSYARDNLYDVIGKSKEALIDMIDVAKQSQHPRAYEVLNSMLKNVADMGHDLVELQKKKKELRGSSNESVPQTVNNNLFVGSTAELLERLNKK